MACHWSIWLSSGSPSSATIDYDPYGRRTKVSGSYDADFGYTGHFHKQPGWMTTGVNLAMFRVYDPELGRWLSRDPIGEDEEIPNGLNLYGYVGNNPNYWTDPLGLFPGQMPPAPPGYDPQTWTQGQWAKGRWFLRDPYGKLWTAHPEDDAHWRHWDVEDPSGKGGKGGGKGRWPYKSKKKWPNQKRPAKCDQSDDDPNGDAPDWTPIPRTMIDQGDTFVPYGPFNFNMGWWGGAAAPEPVVPFRVPLYVP